MLRLAFYGLLFSVACTVALVIGVAWWALPQLPPTARLQDVHFQTPLKIYTRDGSLIAEFGEKRRTPVAIEKVPLQLKQAFIAAEDDRFYQHPGVDWMALMRAALNLVRSQERSQGGSTITMQVARNFFLSREKTYQRKLKEIVLAMKIERELSKDQILELYLNKIFLGQRAYGVVAAAQVYFGSPLENLTLTEAALIAGLPKAPSRLNPIADPQAALIRRTYVLGRMLALGFISQREFEAARDAPLTAKMHGQPVETSAPHLAEMAREYMVGKFGEDAYTKGFRVFTTVSSDNQYAAMKALRGALGDYDRRHGYRGPEASADLSKTPQAKWIELLNPYQPIGEASPVLVTAVHERAVEALDTRGTTLTIQWSGLSWARQYVSTDQLGKAPQRAADLVKPGDIVRVSWVDAKTAGAATSAANAGFWRLAQTPNVEGALVSLDSHDGAILALVGGYDFALSKFNRVIQAMRQPGSNFKPFIYSAALENGFSPSSYVNDAPIVFETPGLEGAWRPENYSGTYYGPTRLRDALANSRNLVSIRVMREMGIKKTLEHVSRFGFNSATLPHNLSLSLGTGELTPLQLATGYAVFANGGFLVSPYFVARIESSAGTTVFTETPKIACAQCEIVSAATTPEPTDLETLRAAEKALPAARAPRAIDAQNAWLMYSMMKDVITRGTGRRALELKRTDLGGKTGTTNDLKDGWFSGFNGRVVTTTWVGSDDSLTLGPQETGARTALPMWIDYMRVALRDMPMTEPDLPAGLVTVRTNAGGRAAFETFRAQDVPRASSQPGTHYQAAETKPSAVDQLF
jgi:penicillin-binding protein 1A